MKKTNNFLTAGIIGIIATVLSNFLARAFYTRAFYIFLFSKLVNLMNVVYIFISMLAVLIIYCKLICKREIHISRFVLFSAAAAVTNVILIAFISSFLIRLNLFSLFNYLIDFIVLTGFAIITLNKTETLQENAEYMPEDQTEKIKAGRKYYPSFLAVTIIECIIFTAAAVCITGFICNWDFEPTMVFSLILIYMVFSLLYTYLYFLPYLIANKKSHPQTRAIYILNIFAGWTFIGWLIALIWGCTEPSEKKVIRETVQVSGADELIKYKSLLDTGVITQEEFDNKKDQLLHGN